MKKMKIGDPLDRSTDHGPQNHKAHLEKLVEYCQTGVREGATLVCGGKQVQRAGTPGSPEPRSPRSGGHAGVTVEAGCVCRLFLRAHGVHGRPGRHAHRSGGIVWPRHDHFQVQERVNSFIATVVVVHDAHEAVLSGCFSVCIPRLRPRLKRGG